MNKFKWILNWSLGEVHFTADEIIPVKYLGENIGNCKIVVNGINVIGEFSLNKSLEDTDYLLYIVSTIENTEELWLSGIIILPPSEIGHKKPRKISDMEFYNE